LSSTATTCSSSISYVRQFDPRRANFLVGEFDPRHDHLDFSLDDDSSLVYNDPRRFGMVRLIARAMLASTAELKGLGPEPLSREFNAAYLASKTRVGGPLLKTCLWINGS